MKITALVLISALLLFSTFVQNSEGFGGTLPPGNKGLQRKVCTSGINRQNETKKKDKNERIALKIQFVSVLMRLLKKKSHQLILQNSV